MEQEKLNPKPPSAHQLPEIINGLEVRPQVAEGSPGAMPADRIKGQEALQQLGQAAIRRPHHHGFARHPQDY
ncbi:MAG TPA: hypothetical protein VK712_01915 [Verrucomicrobiae bacterium]|jgi:hypothetical protein|nr:hypothetical protein [Verrucomicrobiae bacterium]